MDHGTYNPGHRDVFSSQIPRNLKAFPFLALSQHLPFILLSAFRNTVLTRVHKFHMTGPKGSQYKNFQKPYYFFFVKVTVKFIRRGTVWRKEREAFPVPHAGNGSKDSQKPYFKSCFEIGHS
jgi:hypothetical protein